MAKPVGHPLGGSRRIDLEIWVGSGGSNGRMALRGVGRIRSRLTRGRVVVEVDSVQLRMDRPTATVVRDALSLALAYAVPADARD